MSGCQLAVIADDLTGACDTGVAWLRAGLSAAVSLDRRLLPPAAVAVLSTESRSLPEREAAQRLEQAATCVQSAPLIYKKMDSVLRGHPGAELRALMAGLRQGRALMAGLRQGRALVALAFPAQRRTTVGGRLFVAGLPLEQTGFAAEAPSADLRQVFAAAAGPPVYVLGLETVRAGAPALAAALATVHSGIIIGDAETDADLRLLAEAGLAADVRLFGGSAGLAHALASLPVWRPAPPPALHRPHGPLLIVAGSRHGATAAQIAAARAAGIAVVAPGAGPASAAAAHVARCLAAGRPAVISTADLQAAPGSAPIAWQLGEIVRAAAVQTAPGALLLTGGEVAAAVCAALGATALALRGEIEPGIPWAVLQGGLLQGATIITKSGSFGGPHVFVRLAQWVDG